MIKIKAFCKVGVTLKCQNCWGDAFQQAQLNPLCC